jgi:NifB/MoaA-like Fe-S oxidoreductase
VIGVENRMFGPTTTTAGLLPGADIRDAVRAAGEFDGVLLPAEALNDDLVFVDDVAWDDVVSALSPARIVAGHELTETLSRL